MAALLLGPRPTRGEQCSASRHGTPSSCPFGERSTLFSLELAADFVVHTAPSGAKALEVLARHEIGVAVVLRRIS